MQTNPFLISSAKFHNFTSVGYSNFSILSNFHFGDRTTLHQIEKLTASIKLSGAYIKATSFFLSQMKLLESGTLSDFTVVIGSESIPVHKKHLVAGSPVYAALFNQKEMIEGQKSKTEVTDVRAEVFKDLLQFIYTGFKPKRNRLTIELLAAANKVNCVVSFF